MKDIYILRTCDSTVKFLKFTLNINIYEEFGEKNLYVFAKYY